MFSMLKVSLLFIKSWNVTTTESLTVAPLGSLLNKGHRDIMYTYHLAFISPCNMIYIPQLLSLGVALLFFYALICILVSTYRLVPIFTYIASLHKLINFWNKEYIWLKNTSDNAYAEEIGYARILSDSNWINKFCWCDKSLSLNYVTKFKNLQKLSTQGGASRLY